ncbi:MAG: FISUMP domain-containing protein [Crocinitomicaceae bacterium]|jgi:uncharacterized protein (TIGR02145 family)
MKLSILVFISVFISKNFDANCQFYSFGAGLTDIDGNEMQTIILTNGQEWTTSNLRTTRFNDGTELNNLVISDTWSSASIPAYSNYSNNELLINELGYLYNFYAISGDKNLCPEGWRIPSELDWSNLTSHIGGLAVAGGKLKANSELWLFPNTGATNEFEFSAIPGGCRYDGGNFNNLNSYAFFWTSSELDEAYSWYRSMKYNSDEVIRNYAKKQSGFSVRCMRDVEAGFINNAISNHIRLQNPVSEFLDLTISDEIKSQTSTYRIFNYSGQLMSETNNFIELKNISNLQEGIYYLELEGQHFRHRLKFIKI